MDVPDPIDIDCRIDVGQPGAVWRQGILADAVVNVGRATHAIQSQFFTNGARASRTFYRQLLADPPAIATNAKGQYVLDVRPDVNAEANQTEVSDKLAAAFVELHEFVMAGAFRPSLPTLIPCICLATCLDMNVRADYDRYLHDELRGETAIDILHDSWSFGFAEIVRACQRMIALNFVLYRGRQFHPFVLYVLCEILEHPDLVPGGCFVVSDCIHSYVHHHVDTVDLEGFARITAPMFAVHDINPAHATFFIENVQRFETMAGATRADGVNRFREFVRQLEAVVAKNFFSYQQQDLLLLRPGIFADMLLNPGLVAKGEYDVSNIVAMYLKEHASIATDDFCAVIRVLDDFAISSGDVVFFTKLVEHHLPLCAGLRPACLNILQQILTYCRDVAARFIADIAVPSFTQISLDSLNDILSRDALQSENEDLVFDIISTYVKTLFAALAKADIDRTWRSCRLHLLSAACLARAFQDASLPKEYLAAALIHKQRRLSGEIDERKCEFDTYAKSTLVLRPRLSLEDLKAREEENRAMQASMDAIRIDPARLNPIFVLGEDGLTLTNNDVENDNTKGSALATRGFECLKGGIFSFELKIEKLPTEFWEILVGIANADHDVNKWVGASDSSWSYMAIHSGSRSYFNTVCEQYNIKEVLKVDDIIGVSVDCSDLKCGHISFSINNADKGVAFEGIQVASVADTNSELHDAEHPEGGVPNLAAQQLSPNVFFPAVSLSRRGVRVRISKFKWRRH